MALIIKLVVGQLELVKTDHLPHPGVSRSQRVRMDVNPWGHWGVCIASHHPLGAVIHIPERGRVDGYGKLPLTQSLEEHFQGSLSPATLPHAPQALICSQGRMCFIATSYLLNESQITPEPLVQTWFIIKTTFASLFPVKLCHMWLLNSLTLSESKARKCE